MHCTECGTKAPEDARFCESCGASLGKTPTQPSPAAAVQQAAAPAVYSAPPAPAYQPPPPAYAPASYGARGMAPADYRDQVMSTGSWLGMFFLTMIPLVNIILILVWAFGGGVNRNKQNFCRAWLLFGLIVGGVGTVLAILIAVVGGIIAA